MTRFRSILPLAATLAIALPAAARGQDPVRTDPPMGGANPPGMEELTIASGASRMNAFIYLAGGAGAHPTALFLHGYPGNERNLAVAQAVRRAGWNVLYIDYRGTWGSGGEFSYSNALADVQAALAFVRSPEAREKYHVDPSRIALVGHSFGGGIALITQAHDRHIACGVGLAAYDAGSVTQPAGRDGLLGYFRATMDSASGPVRGNPDEAVAEMVRWAREWNLLSLVPMLRTRSVLLAAGIRDPQNNATRRALTEALQAAGAAHLRSEEWDTDHSFSDGRLALADLVVGWLSTQCPPPER